MNLTPIGQLRVQLITAIAVILLSIWGTVAYQLVSDRAAGLRTAAQHGKNLSSIVAEHFSITSGIYGSVFFSLTGLHGLHVTIGVLVLIGVLVRGFMGHFSSRNHFGAEGTILYWHFVDAVWIALYVALYAL